MEHKTAYVTFKDGNIEEYAFYNLQGLELTLEMFGFSLDDIDVIKIN